MAPATIRARQLPVRRFAAWLTDEGETAADPFVGLKSPRLDVKVAAWAEQVGIGGRGS